MTWGKDPSEKPNILGRRENLCWSCRRVVNGCSWSLDFIPVDGWDAEPDRNTFKIRNCPLFAK